MDSLDADASQACDLAIAHAVLAHGLDVQLRLLRGDEQILGLDDLVEVAGASRGASGVDGERVGSYSGPSLPRSGVFPLPLRAGGTGCGRTPPWRGRSRILRSVWNRALQRSLAAGWLRRLQVCRYVVCTSVQVAPAPKQDGFL